MPAQRFDLIASIPGAQPMGTGPSSPTTRPTVSITIYRCGSTNPRELPPYTAPGTTLQVIAEIQWFFGVYPQGHARAGEARESTVLGFTGGDVQAVAEDDPITEDRRRLGHVFPAGVAIGHLGGGGNGKYTLPLTLNPNSSGTVYVTVLPNTAFVRVGSGADAEDTYGPLNAATVEFSYSTLSGTQPTVTKPEVDIIVPTDPIFSMNIAPIKLLWDSEMRQVIEDDIDGDIGSTADKKIRIQNGTYEDDSFMHGSSTMDFDVELTGSGECTITIKADSFTDDAGDTGPPSDTSESFLFDRSFTPPNTDTSERTQDITVIYDSEDQSFTSSAFLLPTDGGAFKGVSDLKLIDGDFYGVVQIQRTIDANNLNQTSPARAVLFRRENSTNNTGRIATVKTYNAITDAVRSITKVGSTIYGFEGSYPFNGIGNLVTIPDSGNNVENKGVPWRSRLFNPNASTREDNITYSRHLRMSSPMVTVNDNLYLNPGYGAIRSIKSTDWESSQNPEGRDAQETRIDNWTLLKYGETLDFRPDVVQTNNRTGYDIIKDLASLCFCYIGFDGTEFIMRPKYQPRADLVRSISSGNTLTQINMHTENYTGRNMEFPSSGLLAIGRRNRDKEIFSYSSITDKLITFDGRGLHGTEEIEHCPSNAKIGYIDHIIDIEDASYHVRPINLLSIRQDLQQLYNIIRIKYGDEFLDQEVTERDTTSIINNKPKELELNIDLNHHDTQWVSWLAEQYLNFYKDIRYLIELQLKPSFYIKVGDFIYLKETRNSLIDNRVFQVLRVSHSIKPYQTDIMLRTVPYPE